MTGLGFFGAVSSEFLPYFICFTFLSWCFQWPVLESKSQNLFCSLPRNLIFHLFEISWVTLNEFTIFPQMHFSDVSLIPSLAKAFSNSVV